MISVEQASEIVKAQLKLLQTRSAQAVLADRDYPPIDRVMMDGIAVNWAEYSKGRTHFRISGTSLAGQEQLHLKNNTECIEVMTGTALPYATDLVIPYEHLEIKNNQAQIIKQMQRSQWDSVHRMGSDCHKKQEVLPEGSEKNGPHVGIAASMGYEPHKLFKNLNILLIATGDELVDITQEVKAHQLRRSNIYALQASLNCFGHHAIELAHLPDNQKVLMEHYVENAAKYDVLIYSGGVSKGKTDYLPQLWENLGVQKFFHQVSQRPGKPLWFGKDEARNTLIFGLPGNPVSGLVCLHRYFLNQKKIYACLDKDITFANALTLFVPVKITSTTQGVVQAQVLSIKNSGEFTALAQSDGFIELPKGKDFFKAGEAYPFYAWNAW